MGNEKKEICTIRIIFSAISDEQAIDYKKKIADVLKGTPDAQMQFTIMSSPIPPIASNDIPQP